jgi:hypothetical protein
MMWSHYLGLLAFSLSHVPNFQKIPNKIMHELVLVFESYAVSRCAASSIPSIHLPQIHIILRITFSYEYRSVHNNRNNTDATLR